MQPICSRVKLNREVLEDVMKLKLVPRRRRVPTPPETVTSGDPTPERTPPGRGPPSASDAGGGPVQSSLAHSEESAARDTPGEPRESRVGSREATGGDVESTRRGPSARDTDTHLSPAALAGSERSLRRAFRSTSCDLCGDCKYVYPQRQTSGKQGRKSSNPGPELPALEVKIAEGSRGTEATQIISAQIDQHPKVTLCDVAQKCEVICQDCGYVVPDELQNKVVHCFKREMTAMFRVWPGCSGHGKHDGEGGALDKNGEICPRVQSERGVRLTEHQRHVGERTDAQTTSFTRLLDSRTGQSSANCPASFLLGKRAKKEACRTDPWDIGDDPGPGSRLLGADAYAGKRKKLGNGVNNDILPTTSDSEYISCKNPEKNRASGDGEESRFWMSDDCLSRSEHPVGGSSSFGSAVKENGGCKNACGETDGPINADAASSELLSQVSRMGTDELESCSCQRARAYSWKNNFSCARTCIPWPFSRRGEAFTAHAGSAALPAEPGPGTVSESAFPVQTSHAKSSATDWETSTTLSCMSTPLTCDGWSSLSATPSSLPPPSFPPRTSEIVNVMSGYEETQMTSWSSSSSSPSRDHDSSPVPFHDEQESDDDVFTGKCPPREEQRSNASPLNSLQEKLSHSAIAEECVDFDFELPPMLSPVTSPQSFLSRSPGCSDVEEEEKTKSTDADGVEEESRDDSDCEDDVEHRYMKSEPVPIDHKIKATFTSGVPTELRSSPGTEEGGEALTGESRSRSARVEGSSPSESTGSERDRGKAGGAANTPRGNLNEFTAYEQDILLVDVSQDDPELFENLNQQSLPRLGPTWFTAAPKTRPTVAAKTLFPRIAGPSSPIEQRCPPVDIDFLCDIADNKEESEDRPWRPQCRHPFSKAQSSSWPAAESQTKNMVRSDVNNSHANKSLESRNQPIKTTTTSLPNHIRPINAMKNGPWITSPVNGAECCSRLRANRYCRLYFSETLSCMYKNCRFQHVPSEGDEQFCAETVARFTHNPMCLQKAGAVFTGYYHDNPPGAHFSMPALLSLLWSLLRAGLIADVFSVLRVSLAHDIVPGHEFLLALFNYVREKKHMGLVPELMQLTSKMANAGLVLSLDCLDCVKNTLEVQQAACPNSVSSKSSSSAQSPEYLNLAQAVVEIELCSKQEDWRRIGKVFRSICQSSQHPILVEQISGRIAIALLSESKDKLSLPFAAFAETVRQNDDDMVRSFVGRIGVSLMLRYHKTHQWSKGKMVVEVLCMSKVSYSMLKGLFGNEDRASRCNLITVATELFLLSASVEGALNTLRENEWFLSSCLWPCEPADLESRTRVLLRLAEKTSHRDTLEILCNLPGLKEPDASVDISRYSPPFDCLVQVCLERQILPVASDTVDFMLSKKLAVDHANLHTLLHKLGKQNLWLRAREVYRHSLSVGYYPGVSAPRGFMTLIVPCRLGEVEMALTFEMFITVNATVIVHPLETSTRCLSITLKRTQSCESEYLSAGSRLLSAALIPQPRLIIHYKAVNPSKEQVFTLDIPSARCWLRHNHLWANELWTH